MELIRDEREGKTRENNKNIRKNNAIVMAQFVTIVVAVVVGWEISSQFFVVVVIGSAHKCVNTDSLTIYL